MLETPYPLREFLDEGKFFNWHTRLAAVFSTGGVRPNSHCHSSNCCTTCGSAAYRHAAAGPTNPSLPTATAILPTFTATSNPHVVGADCGACHIEEHKRWSLTLHAADPAAVLTNEEHNKTELLTDECIT
jgi:hypothetical protein